MDRILADIEKPGIGKVGRYNSVLNPCERTPRPKS
jgi:hypothetical protein